MRRPVPLAGRLNERIRFEFRPPVSSTYGQDEEPWQPVPDGEVWAELRAPTGRELQAAGAINAEVTSTLVIRFREGLTAGMRAVVITRLPYRVLEIAAPPMDLDGSRWSLALLVREGMTPGL